MNENFLKNSQLSKDPYKFDLDRNGFPIFTTKNIKLLNALIENDTSCRMSFDCKNPNSSAYLLYKHFPKEKSKIKDVVERINKENSTHLYVSGLRKGKKGENNQGIDYFVEALWNRIDSVEKPMKAGDPDLVDEMAEFVPGRKNLSFASKFCTYCTVIALGKMIIQ